jgi:hypothetical protein
MKSNRSEFEEQIVSMLDKVLDDDMDDFDTRTIDTSFQDVGNDFRKTGKKSKTQSQQSNMMKMNAMLMPREAGFKKSNTINLRYFNPMVNMVNNNNYGYNGTTNFGVPLYGVPLMPGVASVASVASSPWYPQVVTPVTECKKGYFNNLSNNLYVVTTENGNLNDFVYTELERWLLKSERIDERLFARIKVNLVGIIRTQNGSRVLQKYLNKTSGLVIRLIFNEIINDLNDLLIDSYANYFCQKIFGLLDHEDRLRFLTKVSITV